MGGGGLRILGHKKWHVWRRDNIERVLRDERLDAEAQQERRANERRREQEQRAQTLQARDASVRDTGERAQVLEHVNLFQREEDEQQRELQDALHGRSKSRRRSQQHEHDTLGKQGHLPWYAKRSRDDDDNSSALSTNQSSSGRREQKRKRALAAQDPLLHMRPQRPSGSSEGEQSDGERQRASKRSARDVDERTQREYKSEYSTKHRGSSAAPASRHQSSRSGSGKKTTASSKHKRGESGASELMEQLRRERDAREQQERQRADALMRGASFATARR